MSMSLDGYIAGPNDEPDNPGGDGFDRLHEWAYTPGTYSVRPSGPAKELHDEIRSRCCSVVAVGCSRSCLRALSWRSFG
jgi:hypothetical protein